LFSSKQNGVRVVALVHSECYNKIDWIIYEKQKYIAHSSSVWEVQDQDTRSLISVGDSLPQRWHLFLCSHRAEGGKSPIFFNKEVNPILESGAFRSNYL
jgi:hypothetical protein